MRSNQVQPPLTAAAFDALSTHIAIVDESGVILAINRAWRDFAAANPNDVRALLEGANYLDGCEASGDSAAAAFAAGMRAVLRGEQETFTLEYPCHSPTEQRWFTGRATRYEEHGQVRLVTAHEQITTPSQALHESEARFRTMADHAPVMIWMSGIDRRASYFSRSWLEFTGHTLEHALGIGWDEAVHPDDYPQSQAAYTRAFDARQQYTTEYRLRRHDGVYRWMFDTGIAHYLPNGDFAGFIGSCIDITEYKRAQEALAENYNVLRAIAEGIPDAVFLKDLDGRYQMINSAGAHMVNKRVAEVIGNDDTALFSPGSARRVMESDREVIASGATQHFESSVDGAGATRHFMTTKGIYRDHEGSIKGLFGVSRDITRHKQMESELRQSEARYRMLFEDSPISLWEQDFSEVKAYLDALGVEDLSAYLDAHPEVIAECIGKVKIVDVNKATVALYKAASKEELLTQLDRIVPDEAVNQQKGFVLAVANGITRLDEELVNRTLAGDELHVALSWSVAVGHEARYDKILVSLTDVTARKRAEVALRQSEERFSKAFHRSPSAIAISTLDEGRILDVNDNYLKLLGLPREAVIGHTSIELGTWAYPDQRPGTIEHLRATGSIQEVTIQVRNQSGQVRDVIASLEIIELEGQPYILGMMNDITERKRAQEALLESQMFLERAQEVAHIGSWTANLDARTPLMWTRETYRIFGVAEDQFDGTHESFLALVHPDDREVVRHLSEAALTHGAPYHFDHRIIRPDGMERWVNEQADIIHDSAGQPIRVIGTVQDITERKHMEQEMFNAELLRVELEKEKELLGLKQRFISLVSHEFRTPLAVIMSSSELVTRFFDRLSPERQLDHIGEIQSQSRYMVELLDEILTLGKAQAGKLDFKPEWINLESFSRAIVERMQPLDQGRHQISFEARGELSRVHMDQKLLQHILVNLISNAIKYSPDSTEIQFEVSREEGEVAFLVRDQGIGIPRAAQSRLFEPFHRADNVGARDGTGLGLAIVKESVEAHHGAITFETEEGRGTTFDVRLPVFWGHA